jgi:hypothetical protein
MPGEGHYQASGACAHCPYRARCHAARQLVMDRRGVGRHTSCDFYRTFQAAEPPSAAPRPAWWHRLAHARVGDKR